MVVWLTGLSGAGKSTIANAIYHLVKSRMPELVIIDGDVIRELFGSGLGFHEMARCEQIGRIQKLALFLANQHIGVIVAALYSNMELMQWNRANLPDYFEVYVETSFPTLERRDSKGLYYKARVGEIKDVVGVDIPWNVPKNPDMVVCTDNEEFPQLIAAKIIKAVPRLAAAFGA